MSAQEMRQCAAKELEAQLQANYKEWFNLRMQLGSGQKPKTHLFKQIRRRIAQIKTILSEKKIKRTIGKR